MLDPKSLFAAAVTVVLLSAPATADEDHGDDHGDTYLSSTRLSYGVTTAGELGAGDTDVFRIDLQGAGRCGGAG